MNLESKSETTAGGRGLRKLVGRGAKFLYRRAVWPLMPTARHALYNGVPIFRLRKLSDGFLPASWVRFPDIAEYETALVAAIQQHVHPGDRVVIVGGGYGVTTVSAAKQTGPSGSVITFEGAEEWAEATRDATVISRVDGWAQVRHAVVARNAFLYGEMGDAVLVPPDELPECDVLELDCEGAEVEILRTMKVRPRLIFVETHGMNGAPTELVQGVLGEAGYQVIHQEVAERAAHTFCTEHDIQVLVAVRADQVTGR